MISATSTISSISKQVERPIRPRHDDKPGQEDSQRRDEGDRMDDPHGLLPVSVVIVNFNAGEVLDDCLRSVLSQARQVVLVDNASDPLGFEPVVARFAGKGRLSVVRSAFNGGYAYGCNLGIAACTEPTILLLNPDCVAAPGSIESMCAVLNQEPSVGMVGGLITYPDGTEQGGGRRAVPTPWRSFVRSCGLARFSRRWPKLFNDFCLHLQPRPTQPISVEAISGACTLVKREAIDDVGMMDEGYFLHCEDLDFCVRFRNQGWDIRFVPDAPVMHHKGVCSRNRPLFVEWHKHKGMVRFYRKHFRRHYPAGLMGLVVLGVWVRFGAVASRLIARRLAAGMVAVPATVARRRRASDRKLAASRRRLVSAGTLSS
jgi:GT2 family glycosyltransferase